MYSAFLQTRKALSVLGVMAFTACGGGGGVQFPVDNSAAQNQATASVAIAKAAPVLESISEAFKAGGVLPDSNEQAKLPAPSSYADGALQSVAVSNGGAVVVSIRRAQPTAQASKAVAGERSDEPPGVTNGIYKLIWVADLVSPGIIRWYCLGDYQDVETETKGACKYPFNPSTRSAAAMTWGTYPGGTVLGDVAVAPDPKTTGLVTVGCGATTPPTSDGGSGCDFYDVGDWHVLRPLPVLCFKPGTEPAPSFAVRDWTGGQTAVTKPVYGVQLVSVAAADNQCVQALGAGWRMAAGSFSAYTARGNTPTDTRFWVLSTFYANPWCSLGTITNCYAPIGRDTVP